MTLNGINTQGLPLLQALTHQPPKSTGKRKPSPKSKTLAYLDELICRTSSSAPDSTSEIASETTTIADDSSPEPVASTQHKKPELVVMMEYAETGRGFVVPYEELDDTYSTDVREEFRSRDFAVPNAKWRNNRAKVHVTVAYEVKNREGGKGRIHFAGSEKLVRLREWLES